MFWSELLGALVVSAVFQSTLVDMKNGTLPFFRLASPATGSASVENSSPAIRYTTQKGGVLFLEHSGQRLEKTGHAVGVSQTVRWTVW